MIVARPTTFNGQRYRSRLEARWAAFFTYLGWKFEYEPFDLDGWVPDFVLIGITKSVLVEVKPITHFDAKIAAKILKNLPVSQEALLVGCTLPEVDEIDRRPCVGWLSAGSDETGEPYEEFAPFASYAARPDFVDFTSATGSYKGRLSDGYDGGCWGAVMPSFREIRDRWVASAVLVQWLPG